MNSSLPPSENDCVALFDLLAEQKSNFERYLLILRNMGEAAAGADEMKIDAYRDHEAACAASIVAAAERLRQLEAAADPAPPEKARIEAARRELESLRQEAVRQNALTQERLGDTMGRMKNELAAIGERLRAMDGGKTRDPDDPRFIDILS